MEEVFRSIGVTICGWIYPLIPPLYGVFYDLANGQFFTETTINTLSNNLYVLVSVVMLFTFAVTLIKSIVNPDMLTDNKNGTTAFIKRAGLSLVLIVIIPLAFDQMYKIQGEILKNNLIEKIIVGYSGDASVGSIAKKSNAGQVLAASVLVDLLYPKEGATTSSGEQLQQNYNLMITSDISKIKDVGKYINEKYSPTGDEDASDDEKEYVFEFQNLVSIIAGGFILYMLVLFCLDMGVRLIKLGLLEITAPVSVIAYIYKGTGSLKDWTKEVFSTYAQVFVKIAALSIVIFALQNIDAFMQGLDTDHPWLVRVFIVIGLLTLAHQLPDLVSSLFGMKYSPKGGIKGRLSNMAAVGGIAAAAWDQATGKVKSIGKAPIGAVTALGAGAAAGAGKLTKMGAKKIDNLTGGNISDAASRVRSSAIGRGMAVAASGIKAGGGKKTVDAMKEAYGKEFAGEKWVQEQNRTKEISDSAKAVAKTATGVYDSSGNINVPAFNAAGRNAVSTTTNAFNEQVKSGVIKKDNAAVAERMNTARHKNMVAEHDQTAINNILRNLQTAASSTSNDSAKRQINDLALKVSNGGLSASDIATEMSKIKVYTSGGLGAGASDAISTGMQTAINQLANSIDASANGGQLSSLQDYDKLVASTAASLSTAESTYNSMLEVVGEKEKAAIKATVAVGKELSKEQLK